MKLLLADNVLERDAGRAPLDGCLERSPLSFIQQPLGVSDSRRRRDVSRVLEQPQRRAARSLDPRFRQARRAPRDGGVDAHVLRRRLVLELLRLLVGHERVHQIVDVALHELVELM